MNRFLAGRLLAASMAFFSASFAVADPNPSHEKFRDVELAALETDAVRIDDIVLTNPNEALAQIRRALDYIYQVSPSSVQSIRRLQENGGVYVIYNPSYPKGEVGSTSLKLAGFIPSMYDRTGRNSLKRDFVVYVGRFGIKRSTEILARTIVHELVGHGVQHLEGWTETARVLDLECEARLNEEKFLQDARVDKRSGDYIKFRRAMEDHWCSDFNRYIEGKSGGHVKEWDALNPDIARLKAMFKPYVLSQPHSGAGLAALNEGVLSSRDMPGDDSMALYLQGIKYLKGDGVPLDMAKASEWLLKAAQRNLPDAQHTYGIMRLQGQGVIKDPQEAAMWLHRAADQGYPASEYALGVMYFRGEGVLDNQDKGLELLKKAAAKGYEPAQQVLRKNNIAF
ncbi:MAG: hypothetical protein A2516_00550 [Alphaproteobacteria bacterium RIFOXYD12_FULL_60_8]|nr:MAG: hypothetical protein A2516_00550 [Alphaproteobacteria bacterium RIFOXYD12_FULL_60_8]